MVFICRRCISDSMSIYFNASRDKEYDRGGEEILKYDRVTMNAGDGLNPESGVFTCPVGGTYMFIIHLATHKDKVYNFIILFKPSIHNCLRKHCYRCAKMVLTWQV